MKAIYSFLLFLLPFSYASAQTATFSAKSGDKELDVTLSDMNSRATADFNFFKKDLQLTYNVTDQKIEYLKTTIKMAPADIYMTLELGKISGKSIDDVVKVYQSKKGQGWGVIAKDLGIKPGSKEFHQLKNSSKGKNEKMKAKGNSGKGNAAKGNSGKGNAPSGQTSKGNGKKK